VNSFCVLAMPHINCVVYMSESHSLFRFELSPHFANIESEVAVGKPEHLPVVAAAEMRSGHFRRLARLGAVALLLMAVHSFCSPASVWAGCNHLVTSRTDLARLPSFIEPLIDDLARGSEPFSVPGPAPRCSGAWCSGQPATPPVPSGAFEGLVDSWAWCTAALVSSVAASSFISTGSLALVPAHCGSTVFHPPRLVPSA
jgi:hypothetical protein